MPENTQPPDVVGLVRNVILTLAAKGKLILYEQPLQLPDRLCPTEAGLLEKVTSETGRLLAMGKIDIGIDITATFKGQAGAGRHSSSGPARVRRRQLRQ